MCSRKPGANVSRQIGGTRWESRTFLRDDKPSQSHTSAGMLGKQTGWDGGCDTGWEDEFGRGGTKLEDKEKVTLH